MTTRFDTLPTSLKQQARLLTLAGVPALVVHPDWATRVPMVLWMHGRTVDKELDPGRYLRWMRAGIAACAIDLPGHGQRATPPRHAPRDSLSVMRDALAEIDPLLDELVALHPSLFDTARLGIGGMSLGGMITLRRLCDPHRFAAAAVESTTGWLNELYHPTVAAPERVEPVAHEAGEIAPLDPMLHLSGFRPIPLLALHSEADRIVPWAGQRAFLDRLGAQYQAQGAAASLIERLTWPTTGAPLEHAGFGRVASAAKEAQTAFFARVLGA
jgi:alpha-beta hydrolase superfamily lysophospholipase